MLKGKTEARFLCVLGLLAVPNVQKPLRRNKENVRFATSVALSKRRPQRLL